MESPSEELQRYRQRSLIPSHLYRLGTKLFGSEPTRHRVIDAARFVRRELVPHAIHLRRTWDGRPLETAQDVLAKKPSVLQRTHSEQNLNAVKTSDFTEAQYRQWMDERRRTRDGLESMAVSERWLCSKTRTPLEDKLLAELRGKRRATISASTPIPASRSEVRARTRQIACQVHIIGLQQRVVGRWVFCCSERQSCTNKITFFKSEPIGIYTQCGADYNV